MSFGSVSQVKCHFARELSSACCQAWKSRKTMRRLGERLRSSGFSTCRPRIHVLSLTRDGVVFLCVAFNQLPKPTPNLNFFQTLHDFSTTHTSLFSSLSFLFLYSNISSSVPFASPLFSPLNQGENLPPLLNSYSFHF